MRPLARLIVTGAILGSIVLGAGPALAHGIGGRSDLPVPLSYFLAGAAAVLILSFLVLAVLWPQPRLQGGPARRALTERWPEAAASLLRVVGVLALVLVIAAGLFGTDNSSRNIAPVLVWVVFWLVVPFLAALTGDIYSHLNPWRTLTTALGLGDRERAEAVARLGVWPAVVAFLGFAWLELVWPTPGSPATLGVAATAYTVAMVGVVAWGGRTSGLQIADAFTTYNRVISSIAPLGRSSEGRLVWRGWLRALPTLPAWPGLAFFVVAMIGTVTYDGLASTPWWAETFGDRAGSMWFETAGFVTVIAVLGLGYLAASAAAARLSDDPGQTAAAVARSFAHTLVPIALAYAFAHYFTLILFEGQLLISAASDPFGLGWDLFGTVDRRISFFLAPTAVWYVQVAAIVIGHLIGVVLAHDRALAVFPPARAVRTQYAMLVLMVGLTGLGLVILAAG